MISIIGPAPNVKTGKAVLDCGADEVYVGLKNWSLRSPCFEMDHDTIEELVRYANKKHKNVRVALNTYPWESDIPNFLKTVDKLYAIGITHFILADIGCIRLVKEKYPDVYIQASVGADIHSLLDVKALEASGANSVTLCFPSSNFISQVKEKTSLQVETFVHGYLNYTYRARCYMSSYLKHEFSLDSINQRDKSSGSFNREGFCNRACKCFWTLSGKEKNLYPVTMNSYPYLAIGQLSEFFDAGVDAFKIQGRENSFELICQAVSLYRKVVDDLTKKIDINRECIVKAKEIDIKRHEEMRSRSGTMIKEMLGVSQEG